MLSNGRCYLGYLGGRAQDERHGIHTSHIMGWFFGGRQMFRTIVVSVDGSEPSSHALATAVDIAKRYGAHLTIVHAVLDDAPAAWAAQFLPTAQSAFEGHDSNSSRSHFPNGNCQQSRDGPARGGYSTAAARSSARVTGMRHHCASDRLSVGCGRSGR